MNFSLVASFLTILASAASQNAVRGGHRVKEASHKKGKKGGRTKQGSKKSKEGNKLHHHNSMVSLLNYKENCRLIKKCLAASMDTVNEVLKFLSNLFRRRRRARRRAKKDPLRTTILPMTCLLMVLLGTGIFSLQGWDHTLVVLTKFLVLSPG